MPKRVFIIHGWEGHPSEIWFPWLKRELEKKGFKVEVPQMPETNYPKIEKWVPFLAKIVGKPDKDTYFVGHSIGCQAILRYLQTIDAKIGGAVLVTGWFTLKKLETKEEETLAKPWLETPIDFEKIEKTTKNFVAILSDNDPWVPLADERIYRKKLGARTIVLKGVGHLGINDNITELPVALNELLNMAK